LQTSAYTHSQNFKEGDIAKDEELCHLGRNPKLDFIHLRVFARYKTAIEPKKLGKGPSGEKKPKMESINGAKTLKIHLRRTTNGFLLSGRDRRERFTCSQTARQNRAPLVRETQHLRILESSRGRGDLRFFTVVLDAKPRHLYSPTLRPRKKTQKGDKL